jgi:hypothetical protein
MLYQNAVLGWSNGIKNLKDLTEGRMYDKCIDTAIEMNLLSNDGRIEVDGITMFYPDSELLRNLVESFKTAISIFPELLNDTVLSDYSKGTKTSDKLYNLFCYLLKAKNLYRNKDKETNSYRIKYGFLDILFRLDSLNKADLSKLINKIYLNYKENIEELYSISKWNGVLEESPKKYFQVFLGLKGELRAFIMSQLIEGTHMFQHHDHKLVDDMIVISAYLAEVITKNFLTKYVQDKCLAVPGHLSTYLSDYYFLDITGDYSFEIIKK